MADNTESPLVTQLKASLDSSYKKHDELATIIKELLAHNQTLIEQVKQLEGRIQKMGGAKGNREGNQGWISRIVHLINRTGRPMRLTEILHQMQVSDVEGKLQGMPSLKELLSVNLSRAVDMGKLKPFKVLGVRGRFYALPKWVNDKGGLPQKMWDQMY